MHIVAYVQPTRTYLPCTGVGRHINNVLLRLAQRPNITLSLLAAREYLMADGQLDPRSPLRGLPLTTFPGKRLWNERLWKLMNYPKMDQYLTKADCVYSPVTEFVPVRQSIPAAVTIQDIQALETDLPWSNSRDHRWFRFKWSRWIHRALHDSSVVFSGSEFTRQRLIELLGAPPEKIVVVGNGVEPAFFDIAQSNLGGIRPPVEAEYVLVIGGLRLRKGADHVLGVAVELQKRRSSLKIVVAGDSEPAYAAAATSLPNIHLLGKVADEDLPGMVRRATALLFLSPYEGFGIPAAEAMAAGTPAVVAARASLPEVVGDAGIVVDPQASGEIADVLVSLTHYASLRADYRCRGRQRAAAFTWDRCVDRVVQALELLNV